LTCIFSYHYADYYDIRNKSRQDFDIETGYEEGAGINTYPRRALTSGADNALSIFFEYDTEETDFVCNNFHQGFRVGGGVCFSPNVRMQWILGLNP
jgi:amiloride-sensitive sodium channel